MMVIKRLGEDLLSVDSQLPLRVLVKNIYEGKNQIKGQIISANILAGETALGEELISVPGE